MQLLLVCGVIFGFILCLTWDETLGSLIMLICIYMGVKNGPKKNRMEEAKSPTAGESEQEASERAEQEARKKAEQEASEKAEQEEEALFSAFDKENGD